MMCDFKLGRQVSFDFTPFSVFNELRRRSFARDTKAPTFGFELEGDPFLVRHRSPRRQGTATKVNTIQACQLNEAWGHQLAVVPLWASPADCAKSDSSPLCIHPWYHASQMAPPLSR